MNAELEHRGNFKQSDFAQFRPHATVAYVKPESVDRYTATRQRKGIRLPVTSVTVCGSSGTETIVPLQAQEQQKSPALRSGSESKVTPVQFPQPGFVSWRKRYPLLSTCHP
jgi:hypothetical protein